MKAHPSLQSLSVLLEQRILVLDGAMGTMIQAEKLSETDFKGDRFIDHKSPLSGNNDLLNLTKPDLIKKIHLSYLEAGSDIVETNTFNSTKSSQSDYGLEDLSYELNFEAARIARSACHEIHEKTPKNPRFVAGVIGPTSKTASISPDVNDPGLRNINFDALVADYEISTRGLIEGGSDIIFVETSFDTLNAKAAIFAIQKCFEELQITLPIMISGTITDASGRTLSGQTVSAFYNSLMHAAPLSIGFNCCLLYTSPSPRDRQKSRMPSSA